jgi:hypothetical protein
VSVVTLDDAAARAQQIRDATVTNFNTALRVGQLLVDIVNSTFAYTPANAVGDRAVLQALADAAVVTGYKVKVNGGTVNLSQGGITCASGFHLELDPKAVLDISGAANDTCAISGAGSEGATLALTANAAKGATSISLSAPNAATLVQGDLIRVCSDSVFDASSTNSKIGELVRVASVAGTTVTLETPLRGGAYNTANGATASKVTPIENVRITGGKILGGGTLTTAGSDKDHRGIQLFKAYRCVVQDVHFERTDLVGIWFQDSIFCKVRGGHAKDFVNDQQAYGILFDNACQDCDVDCFTAERVRHITTTGNSTTTKGITRRITWRGMKCYSTTPARGGGGGDAFDTHTAAEDLKFAKCTVYSSTGAGFNIECPSASLEDCEAYYTTDAGFVLHNESDQESGFALANCRAVRTTAEGFRITFPTRGATASVRYAKLTGCVAEDTTGISFYVANTINATALRNVTMVGCTAVGCMNANASVWVQNVDTGDINVNVAEPTQVGANLVRIRDSVNVKVSGSLKHATSATGIAVYINATGAGLCQKVLVEGVRAGGTTPVSLRGVFADTNAQNCRLGVNDLQECNTPIDLQLGTGHRIYQQPSVSGNNGDTSPTLTVNSAQTQIFDSPLTAPRTMTAPTASLADGLEFEAVRTANATGASGLTVFGGKVLTPGTSVRYRRSSSLAAWVEVSAATL